MPGRILDGKKGVLFDLYHTLTCIEVVDAAGLWTNEMLGVSRDAWIEQLMEKSPERMKGVWRDPVDIMRRMAHAIDPSVPMDVIRRAAEWRMERFSESQRRMPAESVETVKQLSDAGFRVALVSNADVTENAAWSECPAAPYFQTAVFSCDVGMEKPEPGIYRLALERLGLSASECVFCGDGGSSELPGAKDVGLTTVMTTQYHFDLPAETVRKRLLHADYVIGRLSDILTE
jgi:putative hydrolase of the HAD superfamily